MFIQGTGFHDRSTMLLIPTRDVNGGNWNVFNSILSLAFPQNAKQGHRIVGGNDVAPAYNQLFHLAVESGLAYAMTVEDDMLPPPDAILQLQEVLETHPEYAAVSALYWTKGEKNWPLVLGHPEHPEDFTPRHAKGLVEVNAIPMGCALWRLGMFKELPGPWFEKQADCTQDIGFARKAKAAGYRFAVDCSLRVGHLDTSTGKVY